MLTFTDQELMPVVGGLVVTVIALVLLGAWCLWRQELDIRELRDDVADLNEAIDQLWGWAQAMNAWARGDDSGPGGGGPPDDDQPDPDPDPAPPGGEPDTVIAHPADTFARKQHLLARYQHIGQHRN